MCISFIYKQFLGFMLTRNLAPEEYNHFRLLLRMVPFCNAGYYSLYYFFLFKIQLPAFLLLQLIKSKFPLFSLKMHPQWMCIPHRLLLWKETTSCCPAMPLVNPNLPYHGQKLVDQVKCCHKAHHSLLPMCADQGSLITFCSISVRQVME